MNQSCEGYITGKIVTLTGTSGEPYYRIYCGDSLSQYYTTTCHETALNLSKEIKEKRLTNV